MRPFIGVTLPHFAVRDLKRNALLFDQIAVFELPGLIHHCRENAEYQGQEGPVVAKTLEWLLEQNVIFAITAAELGHMSAVATPAAEAFRNQINDSMSRYIEESDSRRYPGIAQRRWEGRLRRGCYGAGCRAWASRQEGA